MEQFKKFRSQSGAFTLVEVMAVVAIIVILVAILVPVLSSSKRRAYGVTTMSNLKQCYTAMIVYLGTEGFEKLPAGLAADAMLNGAPTKDPLDHWTERLGGEKAMPLIESYAYVRHVKPLQKDSAWPGWYRHGEGSNDPNVGYVAHDVLMVSIWAGLESSGYEFDKDHEIVPADLVWTSQYHVLLDDGSVHLRKIPGKWLDEEIVGTEQAFSWGWMFTSHEL